MSPESGSATSAERSTPLRERDYLERTIATVRNHRDAENCWPSWANIFADEIERLWRIEAAARLLVKRDTFDMRIVKVREDNLVDALTGAETPPGSERTS